MILIAMVVIGIILYLTDIFYYRRKHNLTSSEAESDSGRAGCPQPAEHEASSPSPSGEGRGGASDSASDGGICCGTHVVCEKTNLSPITGEIVYYDDEELDRFRGRDASSYDPDEIEEFRDVLLTLRPEDVAGWSRSIQVREIVLPSEIREELLMIVGEMRGI